MDAAVDGVTRLDTVVNGNTVEDDRETIKVPEDDNAAEDKDRVDKTPVTEGVTGNEGIEKVEPSIGNDVGDADPIVAGIADVEMKDAKVNVEGTGIDRAEVGEPIVEATESSVVGSIATDEVIIDEDIVEDEKAREDLMSESVEEADILFEDIKSVASIVEELIMDNVGTDEDPFVAMDVGEEVNLGVIEDNDGFLVAVEAFVHLVPETSFILAFVDVEELEIGLVDLLDEVKTFVLVITVL